MGDKSAIEWTDATWNAVVGCSRVSAGCQNCYAERVAHRGMAEQHRGLTVMGAKGPRWNGDVRFVPHVLDKPLRWTKPRRVFVNSLSDLFHEGVTNEQIAAVFGVMAACPQHIFQVLTKRPARMVEWFRWAAHADRFKEGTPGRLHSIFCALNAEARFHPDGDQGPLHVKRCADPDGPWPLPNVWLGTSVEDQVTAEERVPLLLGTPAAVRWVSYEPALGPVRFDALVDDEIGASWNAFEAGLHWVVVGGESGPGARMFDAEWARAVIAQGRRAGVPVFVKQLGAHLVDARNGVAGVSTPEPPGEVSTPRRLRSRKGGDWDEWPEALRVREMPEGSWS